MPGAFQVLCPNRIIFTGSQRGYLPRPGLFYARRVPKRVISIFYD
jgi:hypothetical protein